ncbi:unnamed protein product [Prorocentrum cordatum]|uniref:Uncharacterized protein n=1 Tax=Prorocentrum cordatum TaxID=2364126 RepID=A0ABN9W3C6_9DINO|nr:unnamed protein product [Polarella glacialis]
MSDARVRPEGSGEAPEQSVVALLQLLPLGLELAPKPGNRLGSMRARARKRLLGIQAAPRTARVEAACVRRKDTRVEAARRRDARGSFHAAARPTTRQWLYQDSCPNVARSCRWRVNQTGP